MVRGFLVYSSYVDEEEKTKVLLSGRLENKESFLSIHEFHPYFFIKKKDKGVIEELSKKYSFLFEEAKEKNFSNEALIRVIPKNYKEQIKILKELDLLKIETYEGDIKPDRRFLIDNDILCYFDIEGDFYKEKKVNRVYTNPTIKPVEKFNIELKIISLDLESSRKGELLCCGIYSEGYKKSFIVSDEEIKESITCKNEKECLEKIKEEIIKLDPDIITGWNLIDFDLFYLKEKFKKYKISFDIGRNEEEIKLKIEKNFFRNSSADIFGRVVLDGLNLIRDPSIQNAPTIKSIKMESYTLEDVAQAFLGKGKMISSKERSKEIEELYKKNKRKLIEYNLNDCILAYEILRKSKMLDLAIERSYLTGLQINKISSIAAFDSLYIREARKEGIVSPTTKFGRKEERIKGGFVMTPKPGVYKNVLVFDFKSLYPSIIKTFNIDPASFLEKYEEGCIEAPNKAYFKNDEGILPKILEKLHKEREKAKKERRDLSSYSIKILMNSFFGVLASPNCRYFDLRIANAITSFGQEIIKKTAKKIEEKGFEIIYGDTDSVFVNTNLEKEKAKEMATIIPKEINSFYEDFVKQKYKRKSYLELEFDSFYLYLLIPQMRAKEESRGAKKRYAGLVEIGEKEYLEITGLEAIRGDWTEAARNFQRELLLRVFKKEEIFSFIKEYIKKLRRGELDKELVYRKSIRKELEEYTKTTPPHVKAARQLDSLESNIIEYYMTTEGPEPVQKLKHKIDYEHYIEKQIKPIAKTILETIGVDFEKAFESENQKKLF
ncbi:MAG: DNA polymerase II [Candidatus Pacearchaeota archaeon]